MKKKLLVILLIIAAVAIYILFVRKTDFYYAGTIEATKIDLSSRISSVITTFAAKEGKSVKKGEMLVELSCEDFKLNSELANRDFLRAEKLYKGGSIAQESFDHIKTKKEDSALKLDWCTISALKDTRVLSTYREEGEYVNPGTKLLTLINLSEVWTIIYVPAPMLAKLSLGMKVVGVLPELNMQSFEGKITYISDVAEFTPKNVQTREERTRLVFGVKVTFPNEKELLKPGMSLEIKLE